MLFFGLLLLSASATALKCHVDPTLPPTLKIGAATSSYQVEGAWNVSDKAESIWDHFTHFTPSPGLNSSTGDVACDSYNLWQRDIEMLAEMGLDTYRMSISWSRLLPKGYDYYVSKDGAEYYNNLINGLLERGIEPMVFLYHWELPEMLQQLGGWANPLIVDWFADYARVVFNLYGDRVKTWLTINEPLVLCDASYNSGSVAPAVVEPYTAVFECSKNVLIAHAKVWRIYDKEFRHLQNGKVSIANNILWLEPKSPEDAELTELAMQYTNARFTHAIYSEEGGWPPALEEFMTAECTKRNCPRSRLPPFTEDEKAFVKGTYDFVGLNYYTTFLVRPAQQGETIGTFFASGIPDMNVVMESPPNATFGYFPFLPIYPEGLRRTLNWIKTSYGDHEVIITENGFSTSGSELNDQGRINFIRAHLEQILLAMQQDSVNVTGYIYWALMDSFEWLDGYVTKFGLYEVDFTDPLRTRTPRSSANYLLNITTSRQLDIC